MLLKLRLRTQNAPLYFNVTEKCQKQGEEFFFKFVHLRISYQKRKCIRTLEENNFQNARHNCLKGGATNI